MLKKVCRLGVVLAIVPSLGADWLEFRGSDRLGAAVEAKLPSEWSAESVAWKAELPGRGVSSPILVGDRVFVTASSGVKQQRLHVLCFDQASGEKLWERQFWATGRTLTHPTSAVAAPSPASDGERIFAFFSSNDLICLDLDGNLQWYRGLGFDYPGLGNDVGMASSPTVAEGTVAVQIESQPQSLAFGIDVKTGETRWQLDRPAAANWASPMALKQGDREWIVLQSPSGLTAHDPATGEEIWKYAAGCSGITSSMAAGDTLFVPADGLTALRSTAESQNPEVLWKSNKLAPGSVMPLVDEAKIYCINRAGVLTAGNLADGDTAWQLRLKGSYWASPILVGNQLLVVNQDGLLQVVRLDKERGEAAGELELGEPVLGTPAANEQGVFVRGTSHLFRLAADAKPAS